MLQNRALGFRAVSHGDLQAARDRGRTAINGALRDAPDDPTLRLAWAQGADTVDLLGRAVEEARQSGMTWRAISEVLGEVESTVRVRYTQRGGGRWRRQDD